MLPGALQDWPPKSHLAYFISRAADQLDLAALQARHPLDGPRNQPFHPVMMRKVLIYRYATGVSSSRKVVAKLHGDIAFRRLAAGNAPARRTSHVARVSPPAPWRN